MIKKLYNRWKEKKEALELAAKELVAIKAKEATTEYTALYTQACKNVLYLRASINCLSVSVNTMKGKNMTETKEKRSKTRNRIEWYSENLKEEMLMKEHYANLAGISNSPI
jgi:hypothetical protein